MKKLLTLALLFILLTSHELFLKSDSFFMNSNEPVELYLFNGTFDKSENTITRDRIVNARILGPGFEFFPKMEDYYDRDDATFLKWTTGAPGTYVAGISTLPREIKLSATDFTDYLEHEGLTATINKRKAKGISDQPAVEKYSKHVKAIIQVEDKKTNEYSTVLGYPIEFIPASNPYELSVGEDLRMKLLFKGSPLSNQVVHIGFRSSDKIQDVEENEVRTESAGEFSIKIDKKGKWYVASIYMQESREEGIDYESNWATLTFDVK
jgi:hypothetical protein